MLGDTLTVTISGVAKVLPKIKDGTYDSEYLLRESLVEYRAKVRHSNAADANKVTQDRHNVELTVRTFATSSTPEYNDKVYFVLQANAGRSVAAIAAGLFNWAIASSNAQMIKLEGWES